MTKRYMKLLIGLIAAAVIATGAYFGVLIKKNNDAKKAYNELQKLVVFSFDPMDITGMTIKNSSGDYVFQLTSSGWEITRGEQFQFSSDRIVEMAETMSELTATKIISENAEGDLSGYGLKDPLKLSFRMKDGSEYTAKIGNKIPGESSYYLMAEGRNTIYMVSEDDAASISPELSDLKEKLLFNASGTGDITHLKYIDHGNVVYDINKDGEEWKIESPFPQGIVDASKVNSITSLLIRAECVTFIDEELTDSSKFGFNNPTYQLEIGDGKRSVNMIFGNYYDDAKQYIYAYNRELDQIYIFQTATLGFIDTKIEDILYRRLRQENFENISAFDVKAFGTEFSIDYNYIVAEGQTSSYKVNGKSVDRENESILESFNNLINSITGLSFDGVYEDTRLNFKNKTPDARIAYTLKDEGKDYVIELYKKEDDNSLLYVVENGVYTDTLIKKSTIENGIVAYYKELMEKMK